MSSTKSLLDFILSLLSNDDAKEAFFANPDQALADAGLSDVCSEDVSDAMTYVAEYHPVSTVGNREYNVGNHGDERVYADDQAYRHEDDPTRVWTHTPPRCSSWSTSPTTTPTPTATTP
jgi:hypothetical protein